MRINKLTARAIRQASKRGYYNDGGGLYLRVAAGGSKSWVFRFREAGRLREMGLGPLATFDLEDAREKARDCRKQRHDRVDPIAARRAARGAAVLAAARTMTFTECAEAYIATHKAGWRNPKHAAQWPATLGTYAYPVFGSLPVQAIDTGLVMKVLESIWTPKSETAARLRGRIESVLDWATARGYRQGENPARWRGHLENLLPKKSKVRRVRHHAALPYAELPAFMTDLRQQVGIARYAFEFAILTAARTSEVIDAAWSEIDLESRLWVVPGERMKAGKEHRVPLSEPAAAILEALAARRESDFVFPGSRTGRPLSHMAFLTLLCRMGRGDLTGHGFRSTFRTWAAEQTAFPREIAELALGHVVGDAVERAYQRSDLFAKRRQLAEAWAKFCTAPAGTGEVLQLRQR